ncbi:MAG: type II toxin-antitoxin system death-on-curing family toxin [Spirochaetes bacterium]|nr:type II toxin-antitoxin system death-on-curing family toxin [Spirochaetota bacterium]
MTSGSIDFITLAEVIEIHNNQIELYGGRKGIRDISLLSSALAMPKATFDGDYLNKNIFDMAAAYAFHICQNHPFVDGNKRVGLVTALVFLEFNGVEINDARGILYDAMMNISRGAEGKKKLEGLFRKLAVK